MFQALKKIFKLEKPVSSLKTCFRFTKHVPPIPQFLQNVESDIVIVVDASNAYDQATFESVSFLIITITNHKMSLQIHVSSSFYSLLLSVSSLTSYH